MDKLLKVEKEQDDDEEDDCFAPRKLFLFGIESFKPTPAKEPWNDNAFGEFQYMEW